MKERRSEPRVSLHSVIKLSDSQNHTHYYGYIENLSTSGFGMVSPDLIPAGTCMTCVFFVEGISKKVNSAATLVHVREDSDQVYRYGFKFERLSEEDRRLIEAYVRSQQDLLVERTIEGDST